MMEFKFEDVSDILENLGFERSETKVKQRGGVPDVNDLKAGQKPPPEYVMVPAYVFVHEDGKAKLVCKKYRDNQIVDETTIAALEAQLEQHGIAPGFSFEKYVMFSTLNCLMGMAKQMHDMSVAVMDHAQFVMKALIPQAFEKPKRSRRKPSPHDH